jgi:predicted RNA-binding protein YlqC (UPF0109 family)
MRPEIRDAILDFTHDLVCELVDHPELVRTRADIAHGQMIFIIVETGSGELGQVIGNRGRLIEAIRVLVQAFAAKNDILARLQLVDEHPRRGSRATGACSPDAGHGGDSSTQGVPERS